MKILIVAGDPGGANFILPAVSKLLENNMLNCYFFAYAEAAKIFLSLENYDIKKNHFFENKGEIESFLRDESIDLVFTATSVNDFKWEIKCVDVAKKLGITSISCIDFWNNYDLRFKVEHASQLTAPSIITVIDDKMMAQVKALPFSNSKIVNIGSPAYEFLAKKYTFKREQDHSQTAHKTWKIMFVSQHVSNYFRNQKDDENFLGYTENTVLRDIFEASKQLADSKNIQVEIKVLRHTKRLDELDLDSIRLPVNVSISVLSNDERYNMLSETDLVIGMYSNFLIEASMLGAKVCLYQPERNYWHYSESPLSDLKLIIDREEFQSANLFYQRLEDLSYVTFNRSHLNGSVDRLVNLVLGAVKEGVNLTV